MSEFMISSQKAKIIDVPAACLLHRINTQHIYFPLIYGGLTYTTGCIQVGLHTRVQDKNGWLHDH